MHQTVPNIERVKEIKKKVFLQGASPKELCQLIHQNAIIESKANFNNLKGAEGLCSVIGYWKSAFPNAKSTWADTKEKEDGTVVINWEAEASHTGSDFFGVLAKDKQAKYVGQTLYQFNENGQLKRYQSTIDINSIKNQLT
jgi:hypothetical protein